MSAADVAGACDSDSDIEHESDSGSNDDVEGNFSDGNSGYRDKTNDDSTRSDNSSDADDGSDAEFSASHDPLRGGFKTAEGITVTVVKGSIAAQKVYMSE